MLAVKHEPSVENSPEIMQRHRNHSSLAHSTSAHVRKRGEHYVWIWIMLVKRLRSEKTDVVHIRGSLRAKTCFRVAAEIGKEEDSGNIWKHRSTTQERNLIAYCTTGTRQLHKSAGFS